MYVDISSPSCTYSILYLEQERLPTFANLVFFPWSASESGGTTGQLGKAEGEVDADLDGDGTVEHSESRSVRKARKPTVYETGSPHKCD